MSPDRKKTPPGEKGFSRRCVLLVRYAACQLSFLPPSAAHFSSMSVVTDFGRSMA